jgi:hypothetical protein
MQNLGHLDRLSFFIQGPMYRDTTFRLNMENIKGILEEVTKLPPSLYVVRMPRAILHPQRGDVYDRTVEEMLKNAGMPFQIIRPSSELPGDVADQDTGIDCGWRQGVLFLPSAEPSDVPSKFVMRRYTFWTPMPSGTEWPCLI